MVFYFADLTVMIILMFKRKLGYGVAKKLLNLLCNIF